MSSALQIQLTILVVYLLSAAIPAAIIFFIVRKVIRKQDEKEVKEILEKEQNPHLPGR